MTPLKLVVVGAGGFGREVLDLVHDINGDNGRRENPIDVLGVVDDGHPDLTLLAPYGVAHLGPVSVLDAMPADVQYVIAIGSPAARKAIAERLGPRPAATLVHPTATWGRQVGIGEGTVVCAHSSVTNHVEFGRHVQVNLGCTIGHDARLADFVTLSPGVSVSGGARIGTASFLGTRTAVNPSVVVGDNVVDGSGAAVIHDLAPGVTAVGVPARPRNAPREQDGRLPAETTSWQGAEELSER